MHAGPAASQMSELQAGQSLGGGKGEVLQTLHRTHSVNNSFSCGAITLVKDLSITRQRHNADSIAASQEPKSRTSEHFKQSPHTARHAVIIFSRQRLDHDEIDRIIISFSHYFDNLTMSFSFSGICCRR
jgi:hypothetical protein